MAPGDRKQAKLAVVGPGMVERDDRIANSSGTAKARAAASASRSIVEGSELPVLVVRGDRPSRPLVEAPVCQHMLNR